MPDKHSDLIAITCCSCAVEFGITPAMENLRRKDYITFHCPNGHGQAYSKPVVDPKDEELTKLREEVKELRSLSKKLQAEITALTTEVEVWRPRAANEANLDAFEGAPEQSTSEAPADPLTGRWGPR